MSVQSDYGTVEAPNDLSLMVLNWIGQERIAQNKKWGEQHHPDGTSSRIVLPLFDGCMSWLRDILRLRCDEAAKSGTLTWRHILLEEVFEALAESDPAKLRTELIQSAAVIAAWVEDIDSRG